MKSKVKIGKHEAYIDNGTDNLLIALEEKGMPVKYGCLMGICGVCKLKIVQGKESIVFNDEGIIELEKDEFLPCCSKINGDVELKK
tara:strand:- start:720 stop:977 length:258 start_codon:yes stop_codon:yes gene_type:complete